MADALLLENGDRLLLEDGFGVLLLESSTSVDPATEVPVWAQESAGGQMTGLVYL